MLTSATPDRVTLSPNVVYGYGNFIGTLAVIFSLVLSRVLNEAVKARSQCTLWPNYAI